MRMSQQSFEPFVMDNGISQLIHYGILQIDFDTLWYALMNFLYILSISICIIILKYGHCGEDQTMMQSNGAWIIVFSTENPFSSILFFSSSGHWKWSSQPSVDARGIWWRGMRRGVVTHKWSFFCWTNDAGFDALVLLFPSPTTDHKQSKFTVHRQNARNAKTILRYWNWFV